MLRLRIHEILEEQGKTQYWLSKQTGISPNNIAKICNGETSSLRFDTIEKLCLVLNCKISDLFTSDDITLSKIL